MHACTVGTHCPLTLRSLIIPASIQTKDGAREFGGGNGFNYWMCEESSRKIFQTGRLMLAGHNRESPAWHDCPCRVVFSKELTRTPLPPHTLASPLKLPAQLLFLKSPVEYAEFVKSTRNDGLLIAQFRCREFVSITK